MNPIYTSKVDEVSSTLNDVRTLSGVSKDHIVKTVPRSGVLKIENTTKDIKQEYWQIENRNIRKMLK